MSDKPATTTEPKKTNTASWKEVQDASKGRQTATKTVTYNVGTKDEPVEATFVIRMLKTTEKDSIEDRAVRIDTSARSEDRVRTDSGLLKRLILEHGIVEGPAGFTKSRADLDALCQDVELRDQLSDAIDKFTKLTEHTRIGFR